ncbi:MAG: aconitate hydratase [Candidatus Auribacterota bacterium]
MGLTLTEKILKEHLVSGTLKPGEEISIRIDQTLTQDATGTMACLQFEALGVPRVKTELSVSYVDHNVLQLGFENSDDQLYLQNIAEKYGLYYSKAGNGICHSVHIERFAQPGKTLLGSDSHTPTAGGMAMIAIGAGGLDIAIAMGGGPFYMTSPRVVKVELSGKLQPWSTAKDVILKVLQILTTKGNVGSIVEYGGDGVKTLAVTERATITNMGAELGVTTSVFPSDERTREFLKAQGREKCWRELKADPDAQYDRVIKINLSEIEPMIALPHSPDNVVTVKEVEGKKVHQVAMGSCTNTSLQDVTIAAKIMKGKHVHPSVNCILTPGSRQILRMMNKEGLLQDMLDAGVRVTEPNCGFCIGMGHVPPSNSVSLRTVNRNFKGRCGSATAEVYLVSPEVAMASAITGVITDPRTLGEYPKFTQPSEYDVDDSMILPPSKAPESVEITRGPNIGEPPKNEPLPKTLKGTVLLKVGDKITTDHIMPAGQKLKYRSNIPKYSEFVFEPIDPTFAARAMAQKALGNHNFIVGGDSYGQGSSREHAAICPMYLGVKAVIAKAIERIHTANLINFGIVPLTFANADDYDKIDQGDELELSDVTGALKNNKAIVLKNKTKGTEIPMDYSLTERQRKIILAGGLLPFTREI